MTREPTTPDPAELAARATHFTVPALFRRSARLFADRPAVVSEHRQLSYAQLDARTNRLARCLRASGLGRGDCIAVLSTTRPEYIEAYIGAAKAGVTLVALNIRSSPEELAYCLELTRPGLVIASHGQRALIEAAGTGDAEVWQLGEQERDRRGDYERRLEDASPDPVESPAEPEDIHCVLFTSGTTGRPKGAMISQRASVMRAYRCAGWFELTPDDGMIGWIPMFHTGGDECVKATLLSGGRFHTFETADPVALYRGIERHRLTWTALLPGVITDFMHHPERTRHDLSSLRFALGYANMMPRVVQEFTALLNAGFWDTYGQTESSFVVALDLVRPGEAPTLRKRPAPLLDLRLVDEALEEVPPGVPGECVVRGPTVMSGYFANPEATADAFRGGWLHTGDVLIRHEDGTLSFVDRLKYLIKTGGENVYPAEIEQVISAHPAIREACAVSVPDERWGETIKAVVVAEPGAAVTGSEIRDWCRERLPGFKCPRYVQFLDAADVPRSGTGKILRGELERLEVLDEQRV
jgi:acyl-CoA synthetase (AMP-forming)/AMP-acid ligase II